MVPTYLVAAVWFRSPLRKICSVSFKAITWCFFLCVKAKLRSSSWWIRYFVQTSLEENEAATKKFEQAATKRSYKPACQVFHLKSYHWKYLDDTFLAKKWCWEMSQVNEIYITSSFALVLNICNVRYLLPEKIVGEDCVLALARCTVVSGSCFPMLELLVG